MVLGIPVKVVVQPLKGSHTIHRLRTTGLVYIKFSNKLLQNSIENKCIPYYASFK